MEEILSAFSEQGLNPGQIVLDGRIHRFKADKSDTKNSGWYVGWQNHTQLGGEIFQVVVFGNYKEGVTHQYQTEGRKYSAHDRKAIKEQIEKAKKAAEAQREISWREVAEDVKKMWDSFSEEGSSQYLTRKQIENFNGLNIRFDDKGNFYVPARDFDGKIWSFEKIQYDGTKRFHPGGRVQGCFHVIGKLSGHRYYFAEGFSTSASIAIATGEGVVCCFSATNLPKVVSEFRKNYPDGEFIICGDDDKWKDKNTGRDVAEDVAKKCLAKAIFPSFQNDESKPKDWNDLHVLEGIEEVKNQIESVEPADKMALYALGYSDSNYFFTSTANRQIVSVTSFTEDAFLKLMPLNYWEAVFPAGGERARVDWSMAKSELMAKCRAKGIFDGGRVRGAGVWMDDGRIVVNMGDHLLVDGLRVELGALQSRYFYTLGKKLERLRPNALTTEECFTLINACNSFKWARPSEAGTLLAGILVLSRVCGALPVRPHCWITGGAQTGKTTLLENLIRKIMGENKLYVQGNTTEAGVRQSLKADAVPILFDEFETNGPKSAENIAACIELMRASWASSGAVIVKGGSSGNASHFQVRFSAIVSSIRMNLKNDADKGRFTVLELAPHGSDMDHWKKLSSHLAKIDEEYSERLFARTIKMLPVMLANFKKIKSALAKKADSRFGDQYGMILAGYSSLVFDGLINDEEADWLANQIELEEEREIAKQADHDDALTHLLTTKITYEADTTNRREELIGAVIERAWRKMRQPSDRPMAWPGAPQSVIDWERNALINIGIRVDLESVSIAASNHAELETRVWRNTRWSGIWGNSLSRIPGAVKKNARIGTVQKKSITIPIKAIVTND